MALQSSRCYFGTTFGGAVNGTYLGGLLEWDGSIASLQTTAPLPSDLTPIRNEIHVVTGTYVTFTYDVLYRSGAPADFTFGTTGSRPYNIFALASYPWLNSFNLVGTEVRPGANQTRYLATKDLDVLVIVEPFVFG